MPNYEYVCDNCGTKKEESRPVVYRDSRIECPNCKTRMRRKIQAVPVTYKIAPKEVGGARIVDRDQL